MYFMFIFSAETKRMHIDYAAHIPFRKHEYPQHPRAKLGWCRANKLRSL